MTILIVTPSHPYQHNKMTYIQRGLNRAAFPAGVRRVLSVRVCGQLRLTQLKGDPIKAVGELHVRHTCI